MGCRTVQQLCSPAFPSPSAVGGWIRERDKCSFTKQHLQNTLCMHSLQSLVEAVIERGGANKATRKSKHPLNKILLPCDCFQMACHVQKTSYSIPSHQTIRIQIVFALTVSRYSTDCKWQPPPLATMRSMEGSYFRPGPFAPWSYIVQHQRGGH